MILNEEVLIPASEYELGDLGELASDSLDEYKRLRGEAKAKAVEATLHIFWAGELLAVAAKRLKKQRGCWTAFLKEHQIGRTTAWEAIELFRKAKSGEAISGLTPTEAKRKFGVVRPKRDKAVVVPSDPSAESVGTTTAPYLGDGRSAPMTSRRPGELPPDPDVETIQPDCTAARTKPVGNAGVAQSEQMVGEAAPDEAVPMRSLSAVNANEPPAPAEKHSLHMTIVRIVRRLELLVADDLPAADLKTEPTDAIQREIDRGIAAFNTLKGGLSR